MGVFSLSLVDLRWFYQGSSGVLLGSFVFFRLNTYVLRMFTVVLQGFFLLWLYHKITLNSIAIGTFIFYILFSWCFVQIIFSSVYNIYPQEY